MSTESTPLAKLPIVSQLPCLSRLFPRPGGACSVCVRALCAAGFLSIDVDGRVVRVDTFAKLLGPGYRLGWVSGPPAIVQKLSLHFAAVSVGACSLSQVRAMLGGWGWRVFWPALGRGKPRFMGMSCSTQQRLVGKSSHKPESSKKYSAEGGTCYSYKNYH